MNSTKQENIRVAYWEIQIFVLLLIFLEFFFVADPIIIESILNEEPYLYNPVDVSILESVFGFYDYWLHVLVLLLLMFVGLLIGALLYLILRRPQLDANSGKQIHNILATLVSVAISIFVCCLMTSLEGYIVLYFLVGIVFGLVLALIKAFFDRAYIEKRKTFLDKLAILLHLLSGSLYILMGLTILALGNSIV